MAKILIVDDDVACRSVLRKALLRWCHEVVEARDGCEGIEHYDAFRPALVLLDVVMPNRDGFEFLKSIRAHPHRAPIIAISGGGQIGAHDYLRVMRVLGATVLPKPFTLDDLREKIAVSLQPGNGIPSVLDARAARRNCL